MNKLHLYCYVDKRASRSRRELKDFRQEMDRLYDCQFTIKEIDCSKLVWETRNKKRYVSDKSVFKFTEPVYKEYGKKVDGVMFFLEDNNWKQGQVRLRGFKLGRVFNGYYVAFTRFRKDYAGTAEHELLHFIDEFVKVNTGVRLEDIVKVKDFDSDIVHSQKYWKDEHYKYDEVWTKISSYVTNAVFKRRQGEELLRYLMLELIKRLMQQIKLLKYNSNSIPELEIKKMHVDKCYNTVQEIANIGHIDLGHEQGTVNEIVNTPKTASYNWYIPRHGKYVIEFVPKGKAAWHAGRISNPTKLATKYFGGSNNRVDSGEPNNYGYGICYEGLTEITPPTSKQVELCAELMKLKKIDHLPFIEHWQVTSFKPRIVTQFTDDVKALLSK